MKPEPSPERDLTGPACFGALAGTTLAIVLEAFHALPSLLQDADPFLVAITELVVFASGGAALFVILAVLRERLGRRSGRRKRS
jgi:hypothetical protein